VFLSKLIRDLQTIAFTRSVLASDSSSAVSAASIVGPMLPAGVESKVLQYLIKNCCGWRSSLAFLYAQVLGYEHVRNCSDGWSGWSTQYVLDKKGQRHDAGLATTALRPSD
jgi:hypothetical protein